MTPPIPHSATINAQLKDYLKDALDAIIKSTDSIPAESAFRAIYKNSLGTFTPLTKVSRRQLPLLKTACGIVKRCPLLISTRQVQLAYVELRRLIEVATFYPYFFEHPVEWGEFSANPGEGYGSDRDRPISWCAHRELRWYANYIKERYSQDRSGLIAYAVDTNSECYSELSKYVHAALDHLTKKPLTEAFDSVESDSLEKFSRMQRKVYCSSLIVAVAPRVEVVGKLNAVERDWFDWILGNARQMKIRGGEFLAA